MNDFASIDMDLTKFRNADEALEAYAESFVKEQNADAKVIHATAAKMKIISSVIYAVLLFLLVSLKMFYHEFQTFWFLMMVVVITFVWASTVRNRFTTGISLRKKMASMPDADIDSVIASESENYVKLPVVRAVIAAVVILAVGALVVIYRTPHMIYEKNDTGYGVRYYTLSLQPENYVVIPDTWKGEPVTEIRGHVFYGMSSLYGIDLPKGITEIRGNTFEGCSRLRSIVIPEGVTRIAGHAFCNCTSLSEVKIPSTVRSIGSSAFRNCRSLKQITIPRDCEVNGRAFKESPTKINRE